MPDIQYRVMIDDWAGHELQTSFTHAAPEWVIEKDSNTLPRYLEILRDTYHGAILKGTPWRCQGCTKEATELISLPLCWLPLMTIVNRLVPICQFGGLCEKVGEDHLKAMRQQIDTDMTRTTGQSLHSIITGRELLRCGNCHKFRDLKTCRQCRKIS